ISAAMSFLLYLARGKPVVFVLGNHEHWHGIHADTLATARAMAREYGMFLLEDSQAEVAGVRFVGGTLWTDSTLGPAVSDETWMGEEIDILAGNRVRRM